MKHFNSFFKFLMVFIVGNSWLLGFGQPIINNINPDTICAGEMITIEGMGLDLVDKVEIGGNDHPFMINMGEITVIVEDNLSGNSVTVEVIDTDPSPDDMDARQIFIKEKPEVGIDDFTTQACTGVENPFFLDDENDNDLFYHWDFGNGFTVNQEDDPEYSFTYPNTDTGDFEIKAWTELDGCISDTIFRNIEVNLTPVATIINPPSVVCEDEEITFNAGVVSETSIDDYIWNFGGSDIDKNVDSILHKFANKGTKTVTLEVLDDNGCISELTSVEVEVVEKISVSIEIDGETEFCAGDTISLRAEPNGLNYNWSTGDATQSIDVSASGSYGVTISQNGCPDATESVEITVFPLPEVNLGPDQTICEGMEVNLSASVTNGTPDYDYSWSPDSDNDSDATFLISQSTNIQVTVTDSENCEATDEVQVSVGSVSELAISVNGEIYTGDDPIPIFHEVPAEIMIIAPGAMVSWTTSLILGEVSGLSDSGTDSVFNVNFVLPEMTNEAEVEYSITAQVGDCPIEKAFRFEILRPIFIPNLLTPNDDGINDLWDIQVNSEELFPQGLFIQVFNRAGAMVYESQTTISAGELSEKWRGSNCPDGAYWYKITNASVNPDVDFTGAVTLLRGGN